MVPSPTPIIPTESDLITCIFILENLSGPLKDDVRILKYFMSVNGIYGAEIAKQGFSGYVCEVLVYYFGSFENVLKKISKIKQILFHMQYLKIFFILIAILLFKI